MRFAFALAAAASLGLVAPACTTTRTYDTGTYATYDPYRSYDTRGDLGVFRNALDPYGRWLWIDDYGWAWTPTRVSARWRPYTVGRWVYTDVGWTFSSPEPWGWATYHYGRWLRTSGRWLWVPGDVWAPAWVTWRVAPNYIGWAPLPPQAWFSYGAGFGAWPGRLPAPYWVFVNDSYFLSPGLSRYVVPYRENTRILPRAREVRGVDVDRDRVVNRGISVERVERATGRDVERARIAEARDRARTRLDPRDGELRVYRPEELRAQRGVRDTAIARERPPPEAEARLERRERVRETPVLEEDEPVVRPVPRAPGERRAPVQRPTPRAPERRGPVQRPTPRAPERRGPVQRPTPRAPERRGPVQRPTPRAPEPRGALERPAPGFDLSPRIEAVPNLDLETDLEPGFERGLEPAPRVAPRPAPGFEPRSAPGFSPAPRAAPSPGLDARSSPARPAPQRVERDRGAPPSRTAPAAPSRPTPRAPAGKTEPRGR